MVPENVPLDPESCVGDREIIRRPAAGPDFFQPGNVSKQWIANYQLLVVPNETGAERRRVNQNNCNNDQRNLGDPLPSLIIPLDSPGRRRFFHRSQAKDFRRLFLFVISPLFVTLSDYA